MAKKIFLIAAVADNNVIGKNNDLVWRIKDDMRFFKETTTGHVLLMGRKNFESIPEKFRPLPNRLNCILTRNKTYEAADCVTIDSIENWIDLYKNDDRELFIIGGGQVYKEAMEKKLVDVMYITHVHGEPDGDTFFPEIDPNQWRVDVLQEGLKNDGNEFAYTIKKYSRK